jgi:hypothetical protein
MVFFTPPNIGRATGLVSDQLGKQARHGCDSRKAPGVCPAIVRRLNVRAGLGDAANKSETFA